MDVIEKILNRQEIVSAPPILVDIGASGELHAKWSRIAKHSICIAFDADSRELGFTEKESDTFRKLIVFNSAVTDKSGNEIDFYLTQSPFCSSALEPDLDSLKKWSFKELFLVERKIKLKATQLETALKEAGINRIDWFKTDTQGTDLRLFKSLPDPIRSNVLAAEFEPGIIDGYKGEDKLYEVMQYMHDQQFFMSRMDVKGAHRIEADELRAFPAAQQHSWRHFLIKSPGWAEVTYLNTLKGGPYEKRTYLLAYLFAWLEQQYGFALDIAKHGFAQTNDPFFEELKNSAAGKIKNNALNWPRMLARKVVGKLLSYL